MGTEKSGSGGEARAATQATMQKVCADKSKESALTQILITQQIERGKLQIEQEQRRSEEETARHTIEIKRGKLQIEQEKRRSEEETARHTIELQILQRKLLNLEYNGTSY